MDDIADRAGVSKPVLYQHFPGKLDLYLALLDASCDTIIANCRAALESTQDNKQRVEATMAVFYDYVASDTGAFRLVFESDLTNEPAVREQVERVTSETAALIAEVIHEDTGLLRRAVPAARGLPGGNGPGQRAVLVDRGGRHRTLPTPRRWSPGWRGAASAATPSPTSTERAERGPPWRSRSASSTPRASWWSTPTRQSETIEKLVTEAVSSEGVLTLTDTKGRKVVVPASKLAYVEIGGGVAGRSVSAARRQLGDSHGRRDPVGAHRRRHHRHPRQVGRAGRP